MLLACQRAHHIQSFLDCLISHHWRRIFLPQTSSGSTCSHGTKRVISYLRVSYFLTGRVQVVLCFALLSRGVGLFTTCWFEIFLTCKFWKRSVRSFGLFLRFLPGSRLFAGMEVEFQELSHSCLDKHHVALVVLLVLALVVEVLCKHCQYDMDLDRSSLTFHWWPILAEESQIRLDCLQFCWWL